MEIVRHVKNQDELVAQLRAAAQNDSLFNMVLQKFASRSRNRNTLTPASLKLAMSKDGLNFPKTRYADILRFMSKVGLGKLELGPRGQVRSLNRIPLDLKAIGTMVTHPLKQSEPATEPVEETPPDNKVEPKVESPPDASEVLYSAKLVVNMKGNQMVLPGVDEIPTEYFEQFVADWLKICQKARK